MKFPVLAFILCFFIHQSLSFEEYHGEKHPVPREVINLTRKLSKFCTGKTNVTEEDIQVIKQEKVPETRSGLCFLECLLERLGVIVKGQFRKHGVITAFEPMMKHNPERRKILKKVGEDCALEIEGKVFPECGDLAKELLQCFKKYENFCDIKIPSEYL
ncbi:hypothetical protein CBL_02730 [Carabus blaptoides fortunei]